MLSPMFFRPRPLKTSWAITAMRGGQGGGLSGRFVRSASPSAYFNSYSEWDGDKWDLPFPGIYHVVAVSPGGGGGGGDDLYDWNGEGGTEGGARDELVTLRSPSALRVGAGGPGGTAWRGDGNPGQAVTRGPENVLAGPVGQGGRGANGTTGGYTEAQRTRGQPGKLFPSGARAGAGGNGGFGTATASSGSPGRIELRLVG